MLVDLLASFTEPQRLLVPGSVTMLGFTTRRLEHLVRGAERFHRCTPWGNWLIAAVVLAMVLPGAGLHEWSDRAVIARAEEPKPPADPKPSQDNKKESQLLPTGKVVPVFPTPKTQASPPITGDFVPFPSISASTDTDTEAHRRAVAELTKLRASVSRQKGPGDQIFLFVDLSYLASGGDEVLAYLKDLTDLTSLGINGARFTPAEFAKLKELPPLRSLMLTQVTDNQLASLRGWSGVEEIGLTGTTFSDSGLESISNLPKLRQLMIFGRHGTESNANITDAGIAALKNLENLQLLALNFCPKVKGTGFADLSQLPKLETVVVHGLSLDKAGMAALASLPHVKMLAFDVPQLPSDAFAPLAKLQSIEQLSLNNAESFDDQAAAFVSKLRSLQQLGLFNAKLTNDGLAHFSQLTNLRGIMIGTGRFTDKGLAHLTNLRNLTMLGLSADLDVGDEGINYLAGMTQMTHLDLPGKRITDDGLVALASMTHLNSLNLEKSQFEDPA